MMLSFLLRTVSVSILRAGFSLSSNLKRLRSLGKPPRILVEKPYRGGSVLLIALYEKGRLRPDIERMVKIAKDKNFYVIGVNSAKLVDRQAIDSLFDVYIERFNFGRDFGSYKDGFQYIFSKGLQTSCTRLVMLNDSIFYVEGKVGAFLDSLNTSTIDVLGATENFEIEHHLGSFCISVSPRVLQDARFHLYWKQYRNSDIRPNVIKAGELKLSKTLRACAQSEDAFRALYNVSSLATYLNSNKEAVGEAFNLVRKSRLVQWKTITPKALLQIIEDRHLVNLGGHYTPKDLLNTDSKEYPAKSLLLNSLSDVTRFLNEYYNIDPHTAQTLCTVAAYNSILETFVSGSQIHQNAALLLKLGSPLIKLDGVYRGMFDMFDLRNIEMSLEPRDIQELRTLLLSRPYGGDVLFGMSRMAFFRGLI